MRLTCVFRTPFGIVVALPDRSLLLLHELTAWITIANTTMLAAKIKQQGPRYVM